MAICITNIDDNTNTQASITPPEGRAVTEEEISLALNHVDADHRWFIRGHLSNRSLSAEIRIGEWPATPPDYMFLESTRAAELVNQLVRVASVATLNDTISSLGPIDGEGSARHSNDEWMYRCEKLTLSMSDVDLTNRDCNASITIDLFDIDYDHYPTDQYQILARFSGTSSDYGLSFSGESAVSIWWLHDAREFSTKLRQLIANKAKLRGIMYDLDGRSRTQARIFEKLMYSESSLKISELAILINKSEAAVYTALLRLMKEGYVLRASRGRYTTIVPNDR